VGLPEPSPALAGYFYGSKIKKTEECEHLARYLRQASKMLALLKSPRITLSKAIRRLPNINPPNVQLKGSNCRVGIAHLDLVGNAHPTLRTNVLEILFFGVP
jgi:hypothetical protein